MSGCGGMLGEAFYEVFKSDNELKCTDIDLNEPWLEHLDFRNFDEYQKSVSEFKADFIFHIGAHTDLEYCEDNIDDTYLTNTISVENAVNIANDLNIPILYISTAGIFDGSKEIYDDWDKPNPLCHYARSKHAAEVFTLQHAKYPIVLRAGWMMGGGPKKDKKFVAKLLKQIKDGATSLNVVDDKLGTPTYTYDFASNAKLIIEKEIWGLYNLVCQGVTGRFEVAEKIISILSLQETIRLNKVDSVFFQDVYYAPRPASERLINKKLELRGLDKMRSWDVCLEEYIKNYYNDYLS